MEQRLGGFPTTAEQDARLLGRTGPSALGRIARQIVTFRMLRKRAIAATIEDLKAWAAEAGAGLGAGGGWEGAEDAVPGDSQMSCSGTDKMSDGGNSDDSDTTSAKTAEL